jgi:hypothetical protein
VIPLAADEDFDNRAVRGVLRREPNVNLLRVQDAGLSGACDPEVLEWAAREGRVLLSHDANTMIEHAKRRLKKGLPMPGLFIAPRDLPIGDVVEDVLLVATLSLDGEYEGQVRFLPLR